MSSMEPNENGITNTCTSSCPLNNNNVINSDANPPNDIGPLPIPSKSKTCQAPLENIVTVAENHGGIRKTKTVFRDAGPTQVHSSGGNVLCCNHNAQIHFPLWALTFIRVFQIIMINISMYIFSGEESIRQLVKRIPVWTLSFMGTPSIFLWLYEEYKIFELEPSYAKLQLFCVWTIGFIDMISLSYCATYLYIFTSRSIFFACGVGVVSILYCGLHLLWISKIQSKSVQRSRQRNTVDVHDELVQVELYIDQVEQQRLPRTVTKSASVIATTTATTNATQANSIHAIPPQKKPSIRIVPANAETEEAMLKSFFETTPATPATFRQRPIYDYQHPYSQEEEVYDNLQHQQPRLTIASNPRAFTQYNIVRPGTFDNQLAIGQQQSLYPTHSTVRRAVLSPVPVPVPQHNISTYPVYTTVHQPVEPQHIPYPHPSQPVHSSVQRPVVSVSPQPRTISSQRRSAMVHARNHKQFTVTRE